MARSKLTPKQERFCQCIVEGMSGVEAYLASYNSTNAQPPTLRREANKLLKRDDITARIDQLRQPVINHAQNVAISDREQKKKLINERIQACVEKGDDAAIARYLDILNKMDQEYVNINKNVEEKSPLENLDNDSLLRVINIKKQA